MTDPNRLCQAEIDYWNVRKAIKIKRARDHLNWCYEVLGMPKKDLVYWDYKKRVD